MELADSWGQGDAYETYVGRWSQLVAKRFLDWLDPVPSASWLDLGCGTGALTALILEQTQPSRVRGEDPSEAHVAYARQHVVDARVEFGVGDALSVSAHDGTYDYVVSGLVLNFIPDPAEGITEMKRVAHRGGRVAAYVWDYADGMEMMRYFWNAAAELDPAAGELDEGVRFPVCAPEPLQMLWKQGGFDDVEVTPIDIPTAFADFDDYWTPFLGGQGPAPRYNMSLEASDRDRLRELLRARLPIEPDSSIHLRARAWAIRGTV